MSQTDSDNGAPELVGAAAGAFGAWIGDLRAGLEGLGPVSPGTDGAGTAPAQLRRENRAAADLQAYARCQTLHPMRIELPPMLGALAELLRGTLDAHTVVTVEVEAGCPPCHADPAALHEALVKLAINARDAMPCGGRLDFSARQAARGDDAPAIALSVSDNGVGMTPELAQRACLPFRSSKVGDPLAGLGLAAVDGFACQSGGALAVRSAAGRGTTVTLFLPQPPPSPLAGPRQRPRRATACATSST